MADFLVQNHGFYKVGFATKLKEVVKDLFGVEGKNQQARELLQQFADDCKKWDKDLFTKHFLLRASEHERVVCDDMRFIRESEILTKNGFILVRVEADERIRRERIQNLYNYSNTNVFNHNSETDYLGIKPDFILKSNTPDDAKGIYNIWNVDSD